MPFMKILILLMTLSSSPCFAHAFLDHAEPRVGSTVQTAPSTVTIWFSEEVDSSGTQIQVFDSNGTEVDLQDSRTEQAIVERVSLPSQLTAGSYKVQWQALCLSGHTTKGSFIFTVSE
jgi:methionine-rich copper-binding protein CopC